MTEVAVFEEFGCKLFTFTEYDFAIHFAQYARLAYGVISVEVRSIAKDGTENLMHTYNNPQNMKVKNSSI